MDLSSLSYVAYYQMAARLAPPSWSQPAIIDGPKMTPPMEDVGPGVVTK